MLDLIRSIKALRHVMPMTDAVKLAVRKNSNTTIELNVNGVPNAVILRGGTTDIKCFQQVFQFQEYAMPFNGNFEPKFIIDAGANIGLASVYFASQFPKARIAAIEPEPANFRLLKRNCCFLANVTPIEGALRSKSGQVSLGCTRDGAWGHTVSEVSLSDSRTVQAYSVPGIMSLAGAKHVDLLKLDIEGSELDLFAHDTAWLDHVSVLAIELHDRFEAGCSKAFYTKLIERDFHQEIRGENIFVRLNPKDHGGAAN